MNGDGNATSELKGDEMDGHVARLGKGMRDSTKVVRSMRWPGM